MMPRRNTIEIVINAQDNASNTLRGVADNMGQIGSMALSIGATGMAAATAAVVGFGTASITAFNEFDTGMREVFTLLPGITSDAMGQMESSVQGFMEQTGRATDETLPALYQALSAGVPQDNVFDFLQVANEAARGGVTELTTAVDGITSVVNAYGSDVLEATQASDLMFTAVRLGKTDFEQLSSSLFNVVPVAASLGVGFEDITAGLATITAQGVPTSVATTQMRSAFQELGDTSTDVAQIFEEAAGQTFQDFIQAGNTTADALGLLASEAESTGMPLQNMFGSIEAAQAALALTGANMDSFISNTEAMGESAGATTAAFEQMNDGFQVSLDLLGSRLQSAFVSMGRIIAPAIQPVIDNVSTMIAVFSNAVQTGDRLSDWVGDLAPALRPLAQIIGNVGAGFAEFANQLSLASGNTEYLSVWEQFFTVFEDGSSRIGGIARAMGMTQDEAFALGVSVIDAYDSFVTFIGMVGNFVNSIGRALRPVGELMSNFYTMNDLFVTFGVAIGAFVIPVILSIASALAPVILTFGAVMTAVAALRTAWETNFGGIQQIAQQFVDTMGGLFEAFQAGGIGGAADFVLNDIIIPIGQALMTYVGSGQLWDDAMALGATIWNALSNIASIVGSVATWVFDNIISPIAVALITYVGSGQLWDDATTLGGSILSAIASGIINVATWVSDNIISPIASSAGTAVSETDWSQIPTDILDAIGSAFTTAVNFVTWVTDNFIAPFLDSVGTVISETDWVQVGTDILDAIGSALLLFGDYLTWLKDNVFTPLIDNAASALESVDWYGVGEGIVNAIGSALTATFNFATWLVDNIFNMLTGDAETAQGETDWSAIGSAIMTGLADWFIAVFDAIDWLVTNVFSPLINGASDALSETDWSGVGDGIMTTIAEGLPDIGAWVSNNIINPITNALSNFNPMNAINTGGNNIQQGLAGLSGIGSGLIRGDFGFGDIGRAIAGRQFGGRVVAGQPYLVGERGRELFVPDTAGTITDNDETEALGNGKSVVINFNYSGNVTAEDAQNMTTMIVNELKALGVNVSNL